MGAPRGLGRRRVAAARGTKLLLVTIELLLVLQVEAAGRGLRLEEYGRRLRARLVHEHGLDKQVLLAGHGLDGLDELLLLAKFALLAPSSATRWAGQVELGQRAGKERSARARLHRRRIQAVLLLQLLLLLDDRRQLDAPTLIVVVGIVGGQRAERGLEVVGQRGRHGCVSSVQQLLLHDRQRALLQGRLESRRGARQAGARAGRILDSRVERDRLGLLDLVAG